MRFVAQKEPQWVLLLLFRKESLPMDKLSQSLDFSAAFHSEGTVSRVDRSVTHHKDLFGWRPLAIEFIDWAPWKESIPLRMGQQISELRGFLRGIIPCSPSKTRKMRALR
jgi:hypothetical protein